MRYMKDLIEDQEMKLLDKVYFLLFLILWILLFSWLRNDIGLFVFQWASKSRKSYTEEDLDIVRYETLDYIQSIM